MEQGPIKVVANPSLRPFFLPTGLVGVVGNGMMLGFFC